MVKLFRWDKGTDVLEDLYSRVDQTYCLVRIPVPLDPISTARYAEGIRTGRIGENTLFCMGIEAEGVTAGKIEVTVDERRIGELDIVIDSSLTSKGYGSGALGLFLEVLKEKQICRGVTAYVNAENAAMIRILEKNGFRANRRFQAEVLDTSNGTYAVKAVSGIEYIRFG